LEKAKKFVDIDGNIKDIDMEVLNAKIDELAERSMRVLAFGYSSKELVEDTINDDIVITGLVGIRDDVRPDAKEAISKIQGAGVQLVMITGDRLETARAIAKDAGLVTSADDVVLTSAQLNEMSDDEVKEIIPKLKVIARALPTDKSRMVRLSQELGLVVGMGGDGVNDSPALKRADVGFAMGSGTDVAKEASKIVILDDSLMSIADAIWYGRTIYHNILKFCNFQLVINVCAVVVSAIAPFFGVAEPLKVTHLLFVNLVMDSLGALMLGNEPALNKYMVEKPRRRDESIISKTLAGRILCEAAWLIIISFIYLKLPAIKNLFANDDQHITGYFIMFIVSALFNGFNVRDSKFGIFKGLDKNKNFLRIVCIIALIQAVIVYAGAIPGLSFLGKMFSCEPISPVNYIIVILMSATIIPFDLLRKAICEKE
jgi:calcium-translocating P-type ATPase